MQAEKKCGASTVGRRELRVDPMALPRRPALPPLLLVGRRHAASLRQQLLQHVVAADTLGQSARRCAAVLVLRGPAEEAAVRRRARLEPAPALQQRTHPRRPVRAVRRRVRGPLHAPLPEPLKLELGVRLLRLAQRRGLQHAGRAAGAVDGDGRREDGVAALVDVVEGVGRGDGDAVGGRVAATAPSEHGMMMMVVEIVPGHRQCPGVSQRCGGQAAKRHGGTHSM